MKDLKAGMLTLNAKAHGGKLIGRTAVDIQPVLDNMGKWVDISGELSNKRKRSGLYVLCMRYVDERNNSRPPSSSPLREAVTPGRKQQLAPLLPVRSDKDCGVATTLPVQLFRDSSEPQSTNEFLEVSSIRLSNLKYPGTCIFIRLYFLW